MKTLLFCLTLLSSSMSLATVTVEMFQVNNTGDKTPVGTINATDSPFGLLIQPELHSLPRGTHGFHVHTMPDCADHAMAAGGHYDPEKTEKHQGPYDESGHLGDLPILIVNDSGQATLPVLAPKLNEKDLTGHSIMIHAGGDNYSDTPKALGGGGARIACGVA